jgi:hypothetical protein
MNVKQRKLDFQLSNQEKNQKQTFDFQRKMNELQLRIKDSFNDQKLRFQDEKFNQQMQTKHQFL